MLFMSSSRLFFGLPSGRFDIGFHKKKEENITEHKMWVLIFSTTFVRNISHSKKKWPTYDKKMYIVYNVYWSSYEVLFIVVRF